jgi:hypothetical protein
VTFHETRLHSQAHITSGALVAKYFLCPHLVYQPVCRWGDLGFFQLPQSNSSPEGGNLGGLYLTPHEDNNIQPLSIANNYNGLPYLVSSV